MKGLLVFKVKISSICSFLNPNSPANEIRKIFAEKTSIIPINCMALIKQSLGDFTKRLKFLIFSSVIVNWDKLRSRINFKFFCLNVPFTTFGFIDFGGVSGIKSFGSLLTVLL